MATYDEILRELPQIINKVAGTPIGEITPDKALVNDLQIDSLSMVEIVLVAEDTFNVKIPDEDLKDLVTISEVAGYIEREQA
ncbi:acyl carrier protein [Streptomyces tuirus]|uniref:Acyl carrier protein n=1 Tax=Streptomyces tuirus TaxID=68278 RepID=A0A941F7X8_9ACTN|nr:acyl carrier protein [Streptomyces tuirus]